MIWIPSNRKGNEYEKLLSQRKNLQKQNENEQQYQWAVQNKKRKVRNKPIGSGLICDRMHTPERINTVKICATGTIYNWAKRALALACTATLEKLSRRSSVSWRGVGSLQTGCEVGTSPIVGGPNNSEHGRVHDRAKMKDIRKQPGFYRCSKPSRNFHRTSGTWWERTKISDRTFEKSLQEVLRGKIQTQKSAIIWQRSKIPVNQLDQENQNRLLWCIYIHAELASDTHARCRTWKKRKTYTLFTLP